MRPACAAEQVGKCRKLVGLQVPELTPMAGSNLRVQLVEKRRASVGKDYMDRTAIVHRPLSLHQAAVVKPVQEPGYVRGARNQAAREIERGHRARAGRTKQAERVVLLCGEVVLSEQLVLQRPQPVIRTPQTEEELLFGRVESLPPSVCDLNFHASIIQV